MVSPGTAENRQVCLIDRSRRSNDLHMQLSSLLDQVAGIAREGIEDNLDPGCIVVFKKASAAATEIKQMVKAEIQTHISKGKWVKPGWKSGNASSADTYTTRPQVTRKTAWTRERPFHTCQTTGFAPLAVPARPQVTERKSCAFCSPRI